MAFFKSVDVETVTLYLSSSSVATVLSATMSIATEPTILLSFLIRRYAAPFFTAVILTQ